MRDLLSQPSNLVIISISFLVGLNIGIFSLEKGRAALAELKRQEGRRFHDSKECKRRERAACG